MFIRRGLEIVKTPEVHHELGKEVAEEGVKLYMPEEFDLMPTGRCMFRCPGCWGPHHAAKECRYSAEHWVRVPLHAEAQNRRYRTLNTGPHSTRVCVSGGEPLLYWDILNLLTSLTANGIHTTLSTTASGEKGIFEEAVTSGIDELGIPIDADTAEANGLWRVGKLTDGGLANAIRAIRVAQDIAPNVLITIRTLLHDGNAENIGGIPALLQRNDIDTTTLNWKGYIFNRYSGPRVGQMGTPANSDTRKIRDAIAQMRAYRDMFADVHVKASTHTHPRLLVGPNGECSYAPIHEMDLSTTPSDTFVGNIFEDPAGIVRKLNTQHRDFMALSNNAAGFDMLIQILNVDGPNLTGAQRRLIAEGLLGLEMPVGHELT